MISNIKENLASYVSSHSFSIQAMMKDILLQVISAMMGHERLSTTQIYLKSLPADILDKNNDCLINYA